MNVPDLRIPDTAGLVMIRRWQPRATILADLEQANGEWLDTAYFNISYGLAAQTNCPWAARIWEVQTPQDRPAIDQILRSKNAITCLQDVLDLLEAMPTPLTHYVLV